MRETASRQLPARQRGFALLGLLALVSAAVIFAYVTGLNRSAAGMAQARAQRTSIALAQAKEALIAYAVNFADDSSHANPVPGFLPCPEMAATVGNEGTAAGSCGGSPSALVSALGRLPWRTLGLDVLRDGSNECLWYAVSGTYKISPNGVTTVNSTSNMMNWDTNGQFTVMASDGTTYLAGAAADNRAVAVIFAPGSALNGQTRTADTNSPACAGNYIAANYLEAANGIDNSTLVTPSAPANVSDVSSFIAGARSDTFNDQLVYITRADIWNAIKKRSDFQDNLRALTRRATECIAMYGTENLAGANDKRLPWTGSGTGPNIVSLTNYARNSRYIDISGNLSGRLPYRVSTSYQNTGTGTNNSFATSPFYLLSNASYCAYGNSPVNEQVWYDHWKDHLFYAIANSYRPNSANVPTSCGTCLKINGSGSYAAVIMFAGENLTGLSRTTTDKADITTYLEGRNASNHPNSGGNSNYQAAASSVTFNDVVYALDANLRVRCLSASGNTMVLAPAADPAPLSPPRQPPHFPAGGATPPPGPYAACP